MDKRLLSALCFYPGMLISTAAYGVQSSDEINVDNFYEQLTVGSSALVEGYRNCRIIAQIEEVSVPDNRPKQFQAQMHCSESGLRLEMTSGAENGTATFATAYLVSKDTDEIAWKLFDTAENRWVMADRGLTPTECKRISDELYVDAMPMVAPIYYLNVPLTELLSPGNVTIQNVDIVASALGRKAIVRVEWKTDKNGLPEGILAYDRGEFTFLVDHSFALEDLVIVSVPTREADLVTYECHVNYVADGRGPGGLAMQSAKYSTANLDRTLVARSCTVREVDFEPVFAESFFGLEAFDLATTKSVANRPSPFLWLNVLIVIAVLVRIILRLRQRVVNRRLHRAQGQP